MLIFFTMYLHNRRQLECILVLILLIFINSLTKYSTLEGQRYSNTDHSSDKQIILYLFSIKKKFIVVYLVNGLTETKISTQKCIKTNTPFIYAILNKSYHLQIKISSKSVYL